jgi:hypothetical protein
MAADKMMRLIATRLQRGREHRSAEREGFL